MLAVLNITFVKSDFTVNVIYNWFLLISGGAGCAKSQEFAGSNRYNVIGNVLWHNPSGRTMDPGID